jgi:hypothetical protein
MEKHRERGIIIKTAMKNCEKAINSHEKIVKKMKNKYRILEYKDCFVLQIEKYDYSLFMKKKFFWNSIRRFNSYKECLDYMEELEKYPIIHEVK